MPLLRSWRERVSREWGFRVTPPPSTTSWPGSRPRTSLRRTRRRTPWRALPEERPVSGGAVAAHCDPAAGRDRASSRWPRWRCGGSGSTPRRRCAPTTRRRCGVRRTGCGRPGPGRRRIGRSRLLGLAWAGDSKDALKKLTTGLVAGQPRGQQVEDNCRPWRTTRMPRGRRWRRQNRSGATTAMDPAYQRAG